MLLLGKLCVILVSMTLPIERTWSLKQTREFLRSLLDPKQTPRVPRSIRRLAGSCLRHYPADYEIEIVAKKNPKIFGK